MWLHTTDIPLWLISLLVVYINYAVLWISWIVPNSTPNLATNTKRMTKVTLYYVLMTRMVPITESLYILVCKLTIESGLIHTEATQVYTERDRYKINQTMQDKHAFNGAGGQLASLKTFSVVCNKVQANKHIHTTALSPLHHLLTSSPMKEQWGWWMDGRAT